MKKIAAMFIAIAVSFLLGLVYFYRAFGPAEAEIADWGEVAIYMSAVLFVLSIGIGWSKNIIARIVLGIGYGILALFQVLPIVLWFLLQGYGLTDGPPTGFVIHWRYSLPHIVVFVASIMVIYYLVRGESRDIRRGEGGSLN